MNLSLSRTKLVRRLGMSGALAAILAGVVVLPTLTEGAVTGAAAGVHSKSVHLDEHGIRTVADSTPVIYTDANRWDYFAVINNIRRAINAYNNNVPGSSNTIDHTDVWNSSYFEVAVAIPGQGQLRLRFRRDNMYLVGWFTRNNNYNYVGPDNEAEIPDNYPRATEDNQTGRSWRLNRSSNYADLERQAGVDRAHMTYGSANLYNYALALYNAGRSEEMARGVLYFAQIFAEAARFRAISDHIGWNGFGDDRNSGLQTTLPGEFVNQENQWGTLSSRYNWMLANNRDDDPNNAIWAYYDSNGRAIGLLLQHLYQYAMVMNTVKGFPGRE